MSTFIQVASDVNGPQYAGEATGKNLFYGQHKTKGVTLANTETLEIGLLIIPAGSIITGFQWAISAALLNANATAGIGIRKRATNGYEFKSDGTVSAGAVDGVVKGVAQAGTFAPLSIAAVLDDASGSSGSLVVQPGRWKIDVDDDGSFKTKEDLIISLLITASGASVVNAGRDVFIGVDGVFRGI